MTTRCVRSQRHTRPRDHGRRAGSGTDRAARRATRPRRSPRPDEREREAPGANGPRERDAVPARVEPDVLFGREHRVCLLRRRAHNPSQWPELHAGRRLATLVVARHRRRSPSRSGSSRLVIALLFLGFVIAAAMRPRVEWLTRARVPRGIGVLLHYLGLARPRRARSSGSSCRARSTRSSTAIAGPSSTERDHALARDPARDPQPASTSACGSSRPGREPAPPRGDRDVKTRSRSSIGIFFMFAVGGVLDLRARRAIALVPVDSAAAEAQARDARHVGADRPEARRLRARPASCSSFVARCSRSRSGSTACRTGC